MVAAPRLSSSGPDSHVELLPGSDPPAPRRGAKPRAGFTAAFVQSQEKNSPPPLPESWLAARRVLPAAPLYRRKYARLDPYRGPGALSCRPGARARSAGADRAPGRVGTVGLLSLADGSPHGGGDPAPG